jgi:hypothetical protein
MHHRGAQPVAAFSPGLPDHRRANEVMYKAAQTELAVLRTLGDADPEGRRHCIRLLRHFEYRNHMCLVFEPMVRCAAATRVAWLGDWEGRLGVGVRWSAALVVSVLCAAPPCWSC